MSRTSKIRRVLKVMSSTIAWAFKAQWAVFQLHSPAYKFLWAMWVVVTAGTFFHFLDQGFLWAWLYSSGAGLVVGIPAGVISFREQGDIMEDAVKAISNIPTPAGWEA